MEANSFLEKVSTKYHKYLSIGSHLIEGKLSFNFYLQFQENISDSPDRRPLSRYVPGEFWIDMDNFLQKTNNSESDRENETRRNNSPAKDIMAQDFVHQVDNDEIIIFAEDLDTTSFV